MDINSIILRPIITEKSMVAAGKFNYTFLVALQADKNDIKRAVEKKFTVNVLGISTVTIKGRTQKTGQKRIEVKVSPVKKAIVQVKSGQKIGLFDIKEGK